MNDMINKSNKGEIFVAIIGGIIAISSFLMIYITDLYVATQTIFDEEGIIDENTNHIPVNLYAISSYINSTSYKTILSFYNEGILILNCCNKIIVYNSTFTKEKTITIPGIAICNVTYVKGDINYEYRIEKTYKPLNLLILPAFIFAIIGYMLVLISLYKILVLKISVRKISELIF